MQQIRDHAFALQYLQSRDAGIPGAADARGRIATCSPHTCRQNTRRMQIQDRASQRWKSLRLRRGATAWQTQFFVKIKTQGAVGGGGGRRLTTPHAEAHRCMIWIPVPTMPIQQPDDCPDLLEGLMSKNLLHGCVAHPLQSGPRRPPYRRPPKQTENGIRPGYNPLLVSNPDLHAPLLISFEGAKMVLARRDPRKEQVCSLDQMWDHAIMRHL